MNGDIWRTPSGETGPEINRQDIGGVTHVAVLVDYSGPDWRDWRARVVDVPLEKLVLLENAETRYGGARGGRA